MNAIHLAYAADASVLLQATANGAVTISSVHKEDGAPDKQLFEFNRHKDQIVLLDFISPTRFISIDERGHVYVTDYVDGARVAELTIEDDFKAALSPDKQYLFIVQKGEKKGRGINKYSSSSLENRGAVTGDVGKFYIPFTKLFGVSDNCCLLQYLCHELGDNPVQELIGIVDFGKNTLEVKEFANTIVNDFHQEKYPFAIHPATGTGARLDFNQPIEITDEVFCTINVELFDIYTLEAKKYIPVSRLKLEEEKMAAFNENDPDTEAYKEAVEDLYKAILCLRFSPDGNKLWISYGMGALSGVDLATGERSRYMLNAGGTEQGVPDLNSIFGISVYNNSILSISPDEQFIVFSFPNCFVPYALPFAEGERLHKIVPRQLTSGAGVTELVSFGGFTKDGKYLVFAHEAGYIYVVDAQSGTIAYKITEPYIAGISDVDHSSGQLVVAVDGANAYIIQLEEDGVAEIAQTFLPPHTLATAFIDPGTMLFIHHNGAVVLLSEASASMDVHFIDEPFTLSADSLHADDESDEPMGEDEEEIEEGEDEVEEDQDDEGVEEEGDDEDEEDSEEDDEGDDGENGPREFYDYFDQHTPTYHGTLFTQDGVLKAATINEDGAIHVYGINGQVKFESEMESGESYNYNFMDASPDYLIAGNYSDYKSQGYALFKIASGELTPLEKVKDKDIRFLCLKEKENVLLLFNQQSGAFQQVDLLTKSGKTLFTYNGAKTAFLKYNEATGMLLFGEGNGRLNVIDLHRKAIIYCWELKAVANNKELVICEPEKEKFQFA